MRRRLLLLSLAIVVLSLSFLPAKDKKNWNDQSIKVADLKIHYLEAGAGERALVFVPGWTMIAEVWQEQIPYFAARGFHVFALDMRSYGETTKTDGGNTYHQHAADLHAFLQTLEIEHAALVGWSAGVVTLLDFVSSPETLQPEKLVLVDGAPCGFKADDYSFGMTREQARAFLMSMQEDRGRFTDKFIRSMFKSPQPELVYKDLSKGSLKTPAGSALSLFLDGFTGDRRPALARVAVPTLIVMSPENRLLGEYMQSKIANAKLEVIPDAGHASFLEKPQTFNQTLEAFLGEF